MARIAAWRAIKAKLDAACARLEAEARAEAEATRPAYESKKAAYESKTGHRGTPPKPPSETPPPERQSNLTDPDSALMRRSDAHEYRLVAIGRTQPHRPYDFRPPPEPKTPRKITEPWRLAMKAKLHTDDGKAIYKKRKQTVEPVFGIIKAAMGFRCFRLRSLPKVATAWTLIALAYKYRRIARLQRA